MNDKIVFGTDGIRGHADRHPFTAEALYMIGRAIGLWATQKYSSQQNRTGPKVLIGSDTRSSCGRIKQALVHGLRGFQLTIVDGGTIPTPAVYQLISSDESYDFGIVISASHNPYHDNGIKLFDARRCKLNADDEKLILDFCNQPFVGYDDQPSQAEELIWEQAALTYQKSIVTLFPERYLNGITVVLDCAHGATYEVAPAIMRHLGAQVITLAAQPNGSNINDQCGALHPEKLQQAVVTHKADIGFAFDGDGDRIVAVSKDGVLKDGDDILALLLQLSPYKQVAAVVGTVMSNSGFEKALKDQGKQLFRVAVGDKHVVAKLDEHNLVVGGEPSGHIVIKDYLPTGDGILVALKVLTSVMHNNNWELKTFEKFPFVLLNVPVSHKKDLSQAPYDAIIAEHRALIQDGRILVRYSGTENVLRVMTEAHSYEVADAVAQSLAQKLQQSLKS